MIIEQRLSVQASREKVWAFLLNVPEMSACVPGVSGVEETGPNQYKGRMSVSVGPIRLGFDVAVNIEKLDAENFDAQMSAEGSDRRVGGSVKAKMGMKLTQPQPGTTELFVTTDVNMLGKLGQFGQPVIKKKADQVMDEFAKNLRAKLAAQ